MAPPLLGPQPMPRTTLLHAAAISLAEALDYCTYVPTMVN